MPTKWVQPASWSAQEVPSIRTGGAQPNPTPDEVGQIRKLMSESSTSGGCGSPGKLLAFEEIYRSAGIKGARMGYSISKVIEMLENEHIRNLPAEMKRGALLMALEAAGVHVHEVLQDAMLRQSALNSYEAIQRKQQEQYEARKGEEKGYFSFGGSALMLFFKKNTIQFAPDLLGKNLEIRCLLGEPLGITSNTPK